MVQRYTLLIRDGEANFGTRVQFVRKRLTLGVSPKCNRRDSYS